MDDFALTPDDLEPVGRDLAQPECVVAEPDGTLWVSDKRGGVTRIDRDGNQNLLGRMGGEPNGLAMDKDGNLWVANLADGRLYKLYRDGSHAVVLQEINGQPLGAVNFPFLDSRGRLWVSVTSRRRPWFLAASDPQPDGYIVRIDERGAQIVADGLWAANEVRMDAKEEYLYVAETMARRVIRYRVSENGDLGEREIPGPADFGPGAYVDGIAFDAQGNLWVLTVLRNGLRILKPDGELRTVFEQPNEPALAHLAKQIEAGALTPEDFMATAGKTIQFPTSLVFAGPDLQTAYLGSLAMPYLLRFRSPVAGLPLQHWR
ncbi:MAG: SMP-30/gluconolactonase/LRE family protein [Gammaproteobacteria bacterium]|nr:SMP-30/gluconolactonase/LRE family protein [Gammaproteobacteria bacterium]MCP5424431.1 SMP-30/gluconolactonase/LRE family protein [Gammaproteobacteria bacterium]MCP5458425.1 SMP-30/gluconolactonase/LRE family protein [Gammaproteobacteria bacterium]